MSKNKILFVWQNLERGGAETVLINLVESLIDKYQITILCYENKNKFIIPNQVKVVYASEVSNNRIIKTLNKIVFLVKWVKLIKKYDFCILNEVPFLVVLALVVSLFTRKKYIVWAHSCRSEMGSGFGALLTKIHQYALKKADTIVCVSNTSADSMREYVGSYKNDKNCDDQNTDGYALKNLIIINNILKFEHVDNLFKLPQDTLNICAVGRLASEKNFSLLINALYIAIPRLKVRPHLYICGAGEEFSNLNEQINKLNLQGFVTLVGYTNTPLSYIKECDIFVLPSSSDACPVVVCEALYYVRPIIATNTGAAEILEYGKYGIVIDKNNLDQLVDSLVLLANDKCLREKYSQAARGAITKFTSSLIVNKWQRLLVG
ncbi:MAG: hypothetical protein QG673_266 [Pseudomonadota bacterium]|nr:hypothetical protein [Pseudomonadota bacterium]